MRIILKIIFVFLIFNTKLFGQTTDSTKMKSLIVYGDDFSFSVKEPNNWIGDIDNASKYYSNIVFYKSIKDLNNGGALIQVLIFKKQDENTIEDLKYDVDKYKKKYTDIKEKDIQIVHKDYQCFSKIVLVEKKFTQYISYINPGEKYKNGFSVSMNISKRDATEDERQAFEKIIESLWMMK